MTNFKELVEARDHKAELEKRLVYFASKGDEKGFMNVKMKSVEYFIKRGYDEKNKAIQNAKWYRNAAEKNAAEKYEEYREKYQ